MAHKDLGSKEFESGAIDTPSTCRSIILAGYGIDSKYPGSSPGFSPGRWSFCDIGTSVYYVPGILYGHVKDATAPSVTFAGALENTWAHWATSQRHKPILVTHGSWPQLLVQRRDWLICQAGHRAIAA
jgi:hypothetical protein